jgi:hypothetical protein
VATLLEAVGATVDRRHPARTRARLERTLETLLAGWVIAAWQYDRWDEAHATRPGWVDHWLQATILIEPPEVIQQQYQRLTCMRPRRGPPSRHQTRWGSASSGGDGSVD